VQEFFFERLYLPFFRVYRSRINGGNVAKATILVRNFRIEHYKKICIIEGVSFIGVKHKYKTYLNILSCVEII
jgi:hypothetical protein